MLSSSLSRRVCVSLLVLVMGVAACKSNSDADQKVALSVFAASSLTEAFGELERGFEALHPTVDVQVTFSGSQILRLQIEQGAAAAVFASANESHMQSLIEGGLVEQAQVFGRNELVVIVPTDNPAGIDSFADLNEASRLVIGTDNVPVGIYTRQVFKQARAVYGENFVDAVLDRVVSQESNVRLVRAKVELGEADAAVVYRTDALASDRVQIVPIPDALDAPVNYTIGALSSAESDVAQAFVSYVLSRGGREVLARHGFTTEGE